MKGYFCTVALAQPLSLSPDIHRPSKSSSLSVCTHTLEPQSLLRLTRPRSPPVSPRTNTVFDPSDARLVRSLRLFLAHAADRPGWSLELEDLLAVKLQSSRAVLEPVIRQGLQQPINAAGLAELELGLDKMLQLFSAQELFRLLQLQPQMLAAPLSSWLDFFEGYGFTPSQVKNLVSQQPEVLVQSNIATAGAAIVHLKQLGFDNDEVRHRVVAYCPQVLAMNTADIDILIRLWSKFKVGVDERAGM